MTHKALDDALKKHDKAHMQFATIEAPDRPRVRTIGQVAFITADALPTLPLILSVTDVRTLKVAQLTANDVAVAVYWMPNTEEQFRVLGRAAVVPTVGYSGTYPIPRGVVYDALKKEEFGWEAKRCEMFNRMSGRVRASWCRPVAGTPLTDGEEEMKKWPRTLPKLGEAMTEEEKMHLETASANFALLLIEPFDVDRLELGNEHKLDKRTRYQRDWEDESNVEFKETLVVP